MEITRMSFFGNPNIGVYAYANDKLLVLPPGLGKDDIEEMTSVLEVVVVEARIAGTILNGVFVAGNSNAVLLPHIVFEEELEGIRKAIAESGLDLEVAVLESKYTALGNILLCNNHGCIVSPLIEEQEIKRVADILGVEVFKARLVNMDVPGSVAAISDHGGVIHPDASEDDLRIVKEIAKVSVEYATVNGGVPFVRSGLIANNKGVVIGGNTTGPEMLRIKAGFEGGRNGR
ncbi:MAG: translation initiation factor IF-6 [Desulfurococcaceae archaeon]